jgi:hypothetical protein
MEVSKNGVIEKIAGYVTQESERRDAEGVLHEEIQVFRGNRDLSGEAFKFIDRADILKTTRPESLLLVERLEYGPAIVHGVALVTARRPHRCLFAGLRKTLNKSSPMARKPAPNCCASSASKSVRSAAKWRPSSRAERSGTVDAQTAAARNAELQKEFETYCRPRPPNSAPDSPNRASSASPRTVARWLSQRKIC